MKTKQLANVLVKILGLSILVHSIPTMINLAFTTLIPDIVIGPQNSYWFLQRFSVIEPVIGICLMVASRNIAAILFKDDDE